MNEQRVMLAYEPPKVEVVEVEVEEGFALSGGVKGGINDLDEETW